MAAPEEKYFAFMDTETGGLEPGKSPVIEVATILTDLELNEIARFEAKIKLLPGQTVDPKAAAVNGYTPEDWKDAVHFDEYKRFLMHHIKMRTVAMPVGYNVRFDREMIDQGYYKPYSQFCPLGYRVVECMSLAAVLKVAGVIQVPDLKLQTVLAALGIPPGKAHSAMSDTLGAKEIFERFVRFVKRAKLKKAAESTVPA